MANVAFLLFSALGMTLFTPVVQISAPPRWPNGAIISVWIDPLNAPSGADALVERALKTWTQAAAGHFTLVKTADKDGALVRVGFVGGDANYGETRPRIDRRTGTIAEADVQDRKSVV